MEEIRTIDAEGLGETVLGILNLTRPTGGGVTWELKPYDRADLAAKLLIAARLEGIAVNLSYIVDELRRLRGNS